MRNYHIITFGCQMNKSDSERVAAVLESAGFSVVENISDADLVVIAACSVRQHAIDRIWGFCRQFNEMKLHKPLITILTGCVMDADREKLAEKFDFVFEIKNLFELEHFLRGRNEYVSENYFDTLPKYSSAFQAFVPIMTGCNNFCSYCAVPYVRGREQSRPVKEILAEIKRLAESGCKEITLLGQNVNSFSPEDKESFSGENSFNHDFAKLLWEVNRISGIERISFVAAHPKDMADEVIDALALPKMTNYLHLAMQSGDDGILQSMNRKYTVADYKNIIDKIRKVKPEIALGTDIIVGFPGETVSAFENTLAVYREMNFDIAFLAQYSPRIGTVAADLIDDVSLEEKKQRWEKLQALMEQVTLEKNQKYLNQTVSVLIDKKENGFVEGNSAEMKRVRVENATAEIGDIIEVKIKDAKMWILVG